MMRTPQYLTRAQGIEIFEHVCAHILEVKVNSLMVLALKKAGITNICDLMSCEPSSIEKLMYVPSKGLIAEHLNDKYKDLILWDIRWIHHKLVLNNNQALMIEPRYEFDPVEFNEYCTRQGKVFTSHGP